ncbi:hypothetical protein ACIPM0_08835 [Pseudomonas sichuanensis]|uniref:hypothetical protein n=1 Tax=Pseudomonas TaxID=286 RepID=UPI0038159953
MATPTDTPKLPARLGIAADLCFSTPDNVGYLADCLLVHEEVVIPLEATVLNRLEAAFETKQLRLLLREKRIRFCPAYSLEHANSTTPEAYARDRFIERVRKQDMHQHASDRNALFAEIEETFIDLIAPDYTAWLPAKGEVDDAFGYYAGRPGYEFLFPSERYYYQTGAVMGIARMNDLLAAGVSEMEMDHELPQLLELCFPIRRAEGATPGAEVFHARKIINDLHKIENLPSFEKTGFPLVFRDREDINKIITTLVSDEAQDLRMWLSKHLAPDLDVRASYSASEKLLPSKKKWTQWMRFGAATGVSTAIGMCLAGPLGAAAGAAVGAIDLAKGEKTTALLDGYHPKRWLSHIQRNGLLNPE